MTGRDPTKDPKAGDVLQLGKVRVRIAPCAINGLVFYELNGKQCQIDKLGWIDWCAAMKAKIIKEAQ